MIKKLKFKNGLSYGNTFTEIDFTNLEGIVLVKGNNGAGKTNIINILEYAAYGKSRKFKKDAIPNWANKNFYSEITLEDPNATNNETKIIRGIAPDICQLEGRDNKYSKPNLDKFIANEVIGIPHELFINTILLSVSDYKSFLDMKDADKTKIIDKLFSTDYYSDMLAISKKKASQLDKDVNSIVALIDDKNKTINDLNLKISNIEEVEPEGIAAKITTIKETIAANILRLQDDKIELPNLEAKLKDINNKISINAQDKQKSIFDINNKRNIKLAELNKQYNQDSIKIETEENELVQNKINELTLSYNNEIKVKEDDVKGLILKNDTEYKEYRTNVIAPSYNKEIADITLELNNKLDSNRKEESDKIHLIASEKEAKLDDLNNGIESNNKEVANKEKELKTITKELNDIISDIKIAENSIKLYEQGRCEMCTVELHNNEYHDARKKQLQESLVTMNENKDRLEIQRVGLSTGISLLGSDNCRITNEINEVKMNAVKLVTKATEDKNRLDNEAKALFNDTKATITDKYKKLSDDKKTEVDKANNELMDGLNSYKSTAFTLHNNQIKEIEDGKRAKINERQASLQKEIELRRVECNKLSDDELKQQDGLFKDKDDSLNSDKIKTESNVLLMKSSISELESNIKAMEGQIEMFTLSMQNSNMSIQLHKMVDDMTKEVDGLYAKRLELMEMVEEYEDLNYLLGENGIKTEYLKQILPLFNATIDEVCDRLNFRYRFTFNEQFDVNLSWNGCKIPNNISKGQESVVNLAISLASIKMILMRKQRINIMFLDELFSNLDPEVIDLAVSMLSEFAKSYGVTLFIMSHTPIPMAHISHIMEVRFDDNFSSLSIDKC